MERTAALNKWKMVGEVLIPGVLNTGDIEKTDGCQQAAVLADNYSMTPVIGNPEASILITRPTFPTALTARSRMHVISENCVSYLGRSYINTVSW